MRFEPQIFHFYEENGMDNASIIAALDEEITRLQQVRTLLNGTGSPAHKATGKRKRTLSPEARARIAAAQRKRWAKQKAGK